jgi:hypothetical protein
MNRWPALSGLSFYFPSRSIEQAHLASGQKNAPHSRGHRSSAEREGNELNSQYVEYQIFELPAKADAMN